MSEKKKPVKKSIHFTLQEKGGVGKSVLSSICAQAIAQSRKVLCLDCDPYNASLYKYKALEGMYFQIVDENKKFLPRKFDEMMTALFEKDAETFIIDNGSSSIMQLSKYMFDDKILEMLIAEGYEVFIHSVLVAGGEQTLVLKNFDQICEGFGNLGANIVVWENQFLGEIASEGKKFEEFTVFKKHENKLYARIVTPELEEIQKLTMEKMLVAKLTFEEAQNSDLFNIIEKSRLRRLGDEYFSAIKEAKLF